MLTPRLIASGADRNNSYREGSASPGSTDSAFCGAIELTQREAVGREACQSREEELPSIHSRFSSHSASPLGNANASNSRRKATFNPEKDADGERVESDPASRVYIRNKADDKVFLLEFKAVDVRLVPLYLKHRTFEDNVNDKCQQPYCHAAYENHYNNRSARFNQLKKTYEIDMADTTDKVTIMSHKKPLFPRPVCDDPKARRVARISDKESNLKRSVIYIRYERMFFEIHPRIMTLRSTEPIDVESDLRRKKLLKELHMALPVDLKNKAKVIVKHKGDVLKFLFSLSEINYSKLKVTMSVGVSAINDNVYVKDFSAITDRKVFLGLPRTQYDYLDPMVQIHRHNMAMKLQGIVPLWKEEQRKKRIREYNQCRKKSVYEGIADLKKGSRICYEGFNCINKAKDKTLSCLTDDGEYENWVISHQKSDKPPQEAEKFDQYDSTFPGEVPDWDLVVYTK